MFEQLPYTEDAEKFKVKLIEPDVKNNPNVILNEFNNIRWTLKIKPQSVEEIHFEYQIEWPVDKEFEISEGTKVDVLE
jgi:hypothetical protein